LPSQSKKPLRVCDPCHKILSGKVGQSNQTINNDSSGEDDSDDEGEENPSWSSTPKFYHGSQNIKN